MPVDHVNGVELYWERRGSGPRLLFCNGSGTTLQAVGPLLDLVAATFDLLAWDYRGLGRSAPVTSARLAPSLMGAPISHPAPPARRGEPATGSYVRHHAEPAEQPDSLAEAAARLRPRQQKCAEISAVIRPLAYSDRTISSARSAPGLAPSPAPSRPAASAARPGELPGVERVGSSAMDEWRLSACG